MENWIEALNNQNLPLELLKTNDYTKKFGLSLTEQDAELLVQERKENLKAQERIEFGKGIMEKLIFAFCDSAYIYQDNYVDTLERLQEIFYLYKNEALDEVTDDELLTFMKDKFENEAQGSLDYLEDTALDEFARQIRNGSRSFIGSYLVEGDANEF